MGEHQPCFPTVFCLLFLQSQNLPLPSHIMIFGSLIFLSGIALFSSAVATPTYWPPSTPRLFEVVVGSLEGNTTYTPPYIVSQVADCLAEPPY